MAARKVRTLETDGSIPSSATKLYTGDVMKKDTSKSTGLCFDAVLTIVFVVLKLTGLIDWSWLWILSPMWISLFCSFLIIGIICFFSFFRSK